jgi:hypothetical protein
MRRTLDDSQWEIGRVKSELGERLAARRASPEAERLLLDGFTTLQADIEVRPEVLVEARDRLVALYGAWGRTGEAARWRERRLRQTP